MKSGRLIGSIPCAAAAGISSLIVSASHAATYQQLFSFAYNPPAETTVGREPAGTPLVVGNTVYGMTEDGGAYYDGAVYDYSIATGTESLLYSFGSTNDGGIPYGALIESGTTLYGMNSGGAVFAINATSGAETTLHVFGSVTNDGAQPHGSLTVSGTKLYGMTFLGGTAGDGLIFSVDTSTKAYSILHNFAGSTADGSNPYGSLLQFGSNLYGLTFDGGANNDGTLFDYNTATGGYEILYNFGANAADGSGPRDSLIEIGTTLYGLTAAGGNSGYGTLFSFDTLTGKETVLYRFNAGTADADHPYGSLVYADGSLFGTTLNGGYSNPSAYSGSVFQYNLSTGTESIVHDFYSGNTDGYSPESSLVLQGDTLYGTTAYGGTAIDGGTLFSIALPDPATVPLVLGVGALFARRRRRAT